MFLPVSIMPMYALLPPFSLTVCTVVQTQDCRCAAAVLMAVEQATITGKLPNSESSEHDRIYHHWWPCRQERVGCGAEEQGGGISVLFKNFRLSPRFSQNFILQI